MTDDEKKLATYLYNTLNGGNMPILAREAEIMAQAKQWLLECTKPEVLEMVKNDAHDTAP